MRRGVCETVIETAINHQIPPNRIRERPQVAHRIRIEIGLRKMPDLGRDGELFHRI